MRDVVMNLADAKVLYVKDGRIHMTMRRCSVPWPPLRDTSRDGEAIERSL